MKTLLRNTFLSLATGVPIGLVGALAGTLWGRTTPVERDAAAFFDASSASLFAFLAEHVTAALNVAALGAVCLFAGVLLLWNQLNPSTRAQQFKSAMADYFPYVAPVVVLPILSLPVVWNFAAYTQLLVLAVIFVSNIVVTIALLTFDSIGPIGPRLVKPAAVLLVAVGLVNASAQVLHYANYGIGLSLPCILMALGLMQLSRNRRHSKKY